MDYLTNILLGYYGVNFGGNHMTEELKDICEVMHDMMFIFEVLNFKENYYLDKLIAGAKEKIEKIESKYDI